VSGSQWCKWRQESLIWYPPSRFGQQNAQRFRLSLTQKITFLLRRTGFGSSLWNSAKITAAAGRREDQNPASRFDITILQADNLMFREKFNSVSPQSPLHSFTFASIHPNIYIHTYIDTYTHRYIHTLAKITVLRPFFLKTKQYKNYFFLYFLRHTPLNRLHICLMLVPTCLLHQTSICILINQ
jgi:hypothetical protein